MHETEKRAIQEKVHHSRGLLESAKQSLENKHQQKVTEYLLVVHRFTTNNFTEEVCWEVYSELSSLIAYLKQLEKNSKWEAL